MYVDTKTLSVCEVFLSVLKQPLDDMAQSHSYIRIKNLIFGFYINFILMRFLSDFRRKITFCLIFRKINLGKLYSSSENSF